MYFLRAFLISCSFLAWKEVILSEADFPNDFAAVLREPVFCKVPDAGLLGSKVDLDELAVLTGGSGDCVLVLDFEVPAGGVDGTPEVLEVPTLEVIGWGSGIGSGMFPSRKFVMVMSTF